MKRQRKSARRRGRPAILALTTSIAGAITGCAAPTDTADESSVQDLNFAVTFADGSSTTIRSVHSGLCLGVKGSSTASGALLQQPKLQWLSLSRMAP